MPVDSLHPEYEARLAEVASIRDAIEGQRVVKLKDATYLPVPPGMDVSAFDLTQTTGKKDAAFQDRYTFYLSFAEFPEIVGPAVEGFQGIIHHKSAKVDLPPQMDYLRESATPSGAPLDVLWQSLTREVLTTGRAPLLCDPGTDDQIKIVWFPFESMINWRLLPPDQGSGPEFVVFRERIAVPQDGDPFKSDPVDIFLELRVLDGTYQVRKWAKNLGDDAAAEGADGAIVTESLAPITLLGRTLDQMPVLVINALDTGFDYGSSPVMGLVRRAYAIYRLSADYKRALYIKGDPQPWIAGIEEEQAPQRVGGEEIWMFSNENAKVNYLDVDGKGIPMLRQAILDEHGHFEEEGGRLMTVSDRTQPESGEALRRRQAAQQMTLKNLVINAGNGLQEVLRKIASVMGLDPELVRFTPDTDFAEPVLSGLEMSQMQAARVAGAPWSAESFHEVIRRGGRTEMSFDDEMESIEENEPNLVPPDVPPEDADVVDEKENEDE